MHCILVSKGRKRVKRAIEALIAAIPVWELKSMMRHGIRARGVWVF
jgi:hypothetical protein